MAIHPGGQNSLLFSVRWSRHQWRVRSIPIPRLCFLTFDPGTLQSIAAFRPCFESLRSGCG
jgi:hypothetical protein